MNYFLSVGFIYTWLLLDVQTAAQWHGHVCTRTHDMMLRALRSHQFLLFIYHHSFILHLSFRTLELSLY